MCSDTIKLNAAVRAYLVSQGYKLTALTLSEEGGANIPAALPSDIANLIDLFQGNAQKVAAAEARQVDIQSWTLPLPQAFKHHMYMLYTCCIQHVQVCMRIQSFC